MTKIDSNLDIESWKILKGYKDNPIIEEVLFKDLINHDFRSFSEKFKSYKLSFLSTKFQLLYQLLIKQKIYKNKKKPGIKIEEEK